MNTEAPYYLTKLKEDLSRRQKNSPSYSLRAYSRDLGIHPATLSLIFKGKRALPIKNSAMVADRLKLGPKERTYFLESLYRIKTRLDDIKVDAHDDRFMLDESYFNVIAEWEHDAILTLFDCQDFICNVDEVSMRLKISPLRAEAVLHNLLTSGLLKKNGHTYEKTISRIRTTEDIKSLALQKSHFETLEMGKSKLELDILVRDFSSMMIALDPTKITEAKTIIREFRKKMAALLRDGKKSEVYQLAIQFYPVTNNANEQRNLS